MGQRWIRYLRVFNRAGLRGHDLRPAGGSGGLLWGIAVIVSMRMSVIFATMEVYVGGGMAGSFTKN